MSNTISISDDAPTVEPRALVEQYRFTLPDHEFTPGFFSSVLFVCLEGVLLILMCSVVMFYEPLFFC